jgi:hypothetical protein
MGNAWASVAPELYDSDISEDSDTSEEEMDYSEINEYTKDELIDYIKDMVLRNLEIEDDFSNKIGTLEIECSEVIPMCIELYEKMSEIVNEAVPKKGPKLNKVYFVKPQFEKEDAAAHIATQNRPVVMYQVKLFEVNEPVVPFETKKITMAEAFNNFTYNKDMIGISKKIMRSIPDYLKMRFVIAYNSYYKDRVSPKNIAFAKGSYIYKASKKGPKDEVDSFRSIMVIPNAVNHFHRILTIRLTNFMMKNNFINTTIQKGAVSGQSKPIFQQVFKVKNIIKQANKDGTPVALMFLDISNAYGNLHLHVLCDILKRYHVDDNLIHYIREFYRNFHYYMNGNSWKSDTYSWGNQGLVQGCPLSPILFVTALNYVLQHLENKYKTEHGFKVVENTNIMFTAYMDDICIICKNRESLAIVYKDLHDLLQLLGLPINHSKTAVMLINDANPSPPIEGVAMTKTQKYLGEYISSNGDNAESYSSFIKHVGRSLENINRKKCPVDEKVDMFNNYLMPYIQYRLTVMFDLQTQQKEKIVGLIMKYLKGWDNNVTLNIFVTVMDTIKTTTDEIIQKMEINENYDSDLIDDTIDLSNFVLTGEVISDYSKLDELELDLEEVLA